MNNIINQGDILYVNVLKVDAHGIWVSWHEWSGLVRDVDLQWQRTKVDVASFAKVGDVLQVYVLRVAVELRQFAASIKHLHPENNPWRIPDIYACGAIFKGSVIQKCDYGDIILFETGATALCLTESVLPSELEIGVWLYFKVIEAIPEREQLICIPITVAHHALITPPT